MQAETIDVFEFCRRGEQLGGAVPVADLPRLSAEVLGKSGELHWSLSGGRDPRGTPLLELQLKGEVELRCQRCLGGMPLPIDSITSIAVAADEAAADELDALLEEEPIEVVVGSQEFDVMVLVEDEALLALPSAPRHEVCPTQSSNVAAAPLAAPSEKKASPFAVLKDLKHKR